MGAQTGWEEPSAHRGAAEPTAPRAVGGARFLLVALLAVLATALLLRTGPGQLGERNGLPGALPLIEATAEPAPPVATVQPTVEPEASVAMRFSDLDESGGVWKPLPTAPVSPPVTHEAVLTDRDLIVIGGQGEVAAFAVGERTWRRLEDYPGPVRDGEHVHGLVWTGIEVLALAKPLSDQEERQAVYALDPAAGTWRRLPDGPVPVLAPAVSIWTGAQLIYWGLPAGPGTREGDPAVGAAFDARDGTWTLLPRAPEPRVSRPGGVLTSEGIVIWGQRAGSAVIDWGPGAFAALLNPSTYEWIELPSPPLHDPGMGVGVWNGTCYPGGPGGCERVLIWGAQLHLAPNGRSAPVGGAALDFATGKWTRLPDVPGLGSEIPWHSIYGFDGAWTGGRLVLVGGYPTGIALTLEDGGTSWHRMPPRPAVVDPSVHWTGEELLVWGGWGPDGSSVALESWRPGG